MDEIRVEAIAGMLATQRGSTRATAREAVRAAVDDRGAGHWELMTDQEIADSVYQEVSYWGLQA